MCECANYATATVQNWRTHTKSRSMHTKQHTLQCAFLVHTHMHLLHYAITVLYRYLTYHKCSLCWFYAQYNPDLFRLRHSSKSSSVYLFIGLNCSCQNLTVMKNMNVKKYDRFKINDLKQQVTDVHINASNCLLNKSKKFRQEFNFAIFTNDLDQ